MRQFVTSREYTQIFTKTAHLIIIIIIIYRYKGLYPGLCMLLMEFNECFWLLLTAIISVMGPGCDTCTLSMLISSLIILMAVDIRGRSLHSSCTHNRPTFRNRMASTSQKSLFSKGSTRCGSLSSLYISQACIKQNISRSIIHHTFFYNPPPPPPVKWLKLRCSKKKCKLNGWD